MEAFDAMDRLLRRREKLPSAGTKRKHTEPPTIPLFSTLYNSIKSNRRESEKRNEALIRSVQESIREIDEALAKQQAVAADQHDEQHDMLQG